MSFKLCFLDGEPASIHLKLYQFLYIKKNKTTTISAKQKMFVAKLYFFFFFQLLLCKIISIFYSIDLVFWSTCIALLKELHIFYANNVVLN